MLVAAHNAGLPRLSDIPTLNRDTTLYFSYSVSDSIELFISHIPSGATQSVARNCFPESIHLLRISIETKTRVMFTNEL